MDHASAQPIAIIQGAASTVVQGLLSDFAEAWRGRRRLAGVIEESRDDGCGPTRLRNIADGRRYPIFQDLGAGATGCGLDPTGVVTACEAARRSIAAGCDLAILSKFGKLEAENRSGLVAAFAAAIEADVPILTSVSPRFEAAWTAFAAPLFTILPPDAAAIETWWRRVDVGGAEAITPLLRQPRTDAA